MKEIKNGGIEQSKDNKTENQFQAVLELLKGGKVKEVSVKYKICRSSLYKLRERAISAIQREMENPAKTKKTAYNRLDCEKEAKVIQLCRRYPAHSSYQISNKLQTLEGVQVKPRTIQRIRKRNHLSRIPKRPQPASKSHCFTKDEKSFIREKIKEKLFLGGDRLAWDLQNRYGISISPSTTKRIKRQILTEMNPPPPKPKWRFYERNHPHRLWHGDLMEKVTLTDEDRTAYQLTLSDDYSRAYVFCDLFREVTVNTTIRAMIDAMRRFRTIPQAVVFDNGSYFKGKLLREFCRRLGIRLIHSSVNHPQTNGKLERAFRDDMNEFYKRFDQWKYNQLRKHLPEYIHYRNQIRGHHALEGKPSVQRLNEQDFFALPYILNDLEKFAWCERGTRKVGANGLMRFFQRDVYINSKLAGQKIRLFETLDGLQAEDEEGTLYFLADYKERICRPLWQPVGGRWQDNTRVYHFRQIRNSRRLDTKDEMLRVENAIEITDSKI